MDSAGMANSVVEPSLHFHVAFAFVDGQINPNYQGSDATQEYLRCALVLFTSIRKFHPSASCTMHTNVPLEENWLVRYQEVGCENKVTSFEHFPPPGFISTFQASLFLLDVLSNLPDSGLHVIVDPDVICVAPIPMSLSQGIGPRIGVLEMGFGKDQKINGLSPSEICLIEKMHGHANPNLKYFGGELFVVPGRMTSYIRSAIAKAWEISIQDFYSGKPHLTTEEHVLTYALSESDTFDLSNVGARIWTTSKYRLLPHNLKELALWHLPAEKEFGFRKMYQSTTNANAKLWQSGELEFRTRVARIMHLTGPGFLQKLLRLATKILRSLPTYK